MMTALMHRLHVKAIAVSAVVVMLSVGLWAGRFIAQADAEPSDPPQAAAEEASRTSHPWPMWGYDSQRRKATPMPLADRLHLEWVRELPPPRRAWRPQFDDMDKLEFDKSYSPVVWGRHLIVASMTNDTVTAYDTRTGSQQWRFFADGPLRLAPVVHEGLVYVGSDDGLLYCLDAETGQLRWQFRAGPEDRRLLGNERLINMWPVRGGPVVRDGTIYMAASVWPLMGTFICALDAQTGEVEWMNSGTGAVYQLHQHGGARAFGGVAPQGYLSVNEDSLIVAGGRTVPAVYDRRTGAFKYFRQATGYVGKGAGGYRTAIQGNWFYNHQYSYNLEDGAQLTPMHAEVLTDQAVYCLQGQTIEAYAPEPDLQEVEVENRLGRGELRKLYEPRKLWEFEVEGIRQLHLLADDTLFASGDDGRVVALRLPEGNAPRRVAWQNRVDGTVWEMIAADDRLFVITKEGAIHCFGPQRVEPVRHPYEPAPLPDNTDHWPERARALIERTDSHQGYAVLFGLGTGRLLEELLAQSELHVIAVDPDEDRVHRMRERLDEVGLYGSRASVHVGDALRFPLPPYLANLVVSEDLDAAGFDGGQDFVRKIHHVLRPYGGTAALDMDERRESDLRQWVAQTALPQAELERSGETLLLRRPGPLPGAGSWTHQYADSANTTYSPEELAKAPLGVLWFGGPCNELSLPRHGNGPVPQVVGGRLFLVGVDTVSARDVYTGRELWVRELPGAGHAYTCLSHEARWQTGAAVYMPNQPGANFIGSNYVSLSDGVYVVHKNRCLRLDPATGETMTELALPPVGESAESARWGHLLIHDDLLVAGADPQFPDDGPVGQENYNATSSNWIVVMDRHDGNVLWSREATLGFRHNAIIASANARSGRKVVFAIDGLSPNAMAKLERRGESAPPATLLAMDALTGEVLWQHDEDVFGTWLGYSASHDILIQAGRTGARGTPEDEPRDRIVAYRGAGGTMLWDPPGGTVLWDRRERHTGPLAIHENIITGGRNEPAIDLLTGKDHMRIHPLTDLPIPWTYSRTYGCGTQNASKHLLTFRSGAAGIADLARDAGTANLGGFRSGCTNNMIAADGVLSAPDYTRTCTCAYQNQTSLALIHMNDVEMWTSNAIELGDGLIRRVGINLGAPGNHLDESGLLWMNHPSTGGPSPNVPVTLDALDAEWFASHSSMIATASDNPGDTPSWVAASGVAGVHRISLDLAWDADADPQHYTVRLHFAEPRAKAGDRIFDVLVQGRSVISGLDVAARTGGTNRGYSLEIPAVEVKDALVVELRADAASTLPPVLNGIQAVIEEERLSRTGQ